MARHTAPAIEEPVKAPAAPKLFEKEVEEEDEDGLDILDAPKKEKSRNRDGTIVERIPLGPVEHVRIPSDPLFKKIEPNSGIALTYVSLLPSSSTLIKYAQQIKDNNARRSPTPSHFSLPHFPLATLLDRPTR